MLVTKMMAGTKPDEWELLKGYFHNAYMDSDTHLLGAWADERKLSKAGRVSLSFLYSTCYNVPTAVFLYLMTKQLSPEVVWDKYKDALIFQTDRKWVKIANQFPQLVSDFHSRFVPYKQHLLPLLKTSNPFESVYNEFVQMKNQGRVSAYIFLDGLMNTRIMKPYAPERFDWQNGQTCTEGMFDAIGRHDKADWFKKGQKRLSPVDIDILDNSLRILMHQLREEGCREDNVLDYESNLCAYRKYYKGHMYYGYYMDRQLEELAKLKAKLPEYDYMWGELFRLRKAVYPANLLGEVSGWKGIRKQRFDEFIRKGEISYE
jgi:hypothetical protein